MVLQNENNYRGIKKQYVYNLNLYKYRVIGIQ